MKKIIIKRWLTGVLILAAALIVQSGRVRAAETDTSGSHTAEKLRITLDRPVIVDVKATSSAKIKLAWSKVKYAEKYEIYRASKKDGKYKKIGTTKKLKYTDKTGRQLKTYYYKIAASCKSGTETLTSKESKVKQAQVRKTAGKTAYVGDSVMSGFASYHVIGNTKAHKVFAKIGVSTPNFYNGSLMSSLLSYNPDRMYIMLGINGLPGRVNEPYQRTLISYYNKILKKCLRKNPNMEIIVVGVGPVGRNANVKMKSVRSFNKKLKKMAGAYNTARYLDLAPVLGDRNGYLKSSYSGGDGIHWKIAAYRAVLKEFQSFVKEF